MYNISKGENTMEESEILEPVHKCLRELLDLEKKGKSQNYEYTDHDIVAATLLYSHILGNRLIHRLTDERASIGLSKHLGKTYGEAIQLLTKQMTNVDISVVYNEKGNDSD